jgi:hypothetical protein
LEPDAAPFCGHDVVATPSRTSPHRQAIARPHHRAPAPSRTRRVTVRGRRPTANPPLPRRQAATPEPRPRARRPTPTTRLHGDRGDQPRQPTLAAVITPSRQAEPRPPLFPFVKASRDVCYPCITTR